MPIENEWREPKPQERLVLERMLSQLFVGREALLAQLSGVRVKTIDEDGSLSIKVTAGGPAGIPIRVPVTAHTEDVDGCGWSCSFT